VILESGREDVGRRIATGIGDEHDRALIMLADGVGAVLGGDRMGGRIGGTGLGGLVKGFEPRSQVDLVGRVVLVPAADPQVQRRGDELHRLGDDPSRRERLQGELAGEDVAAAVAAHIHDQPVLR
jgi:hypothetical protein